MLGIFLVHGNGCGINPPNAVPVPTPKDHGIPGQYGWIVAVFGSIWVPAPFGEYLVRALFQIIKIGGGGSREKHGNSRAHGTF